MDIKQQMFYKMPSLPGTLMQKKGAKIGMIREIIQV
jgi:hypothetical protein